MIFSVKLQSLFRRRHRHQRRYRRRRQSRHRSRRWRQYRRHFQQQLCQFEPLPILRRIFLANPPPNLV